MVNIKLASQKEFNNCKGFIHHISFPAIILTFILLGGCASKNTTQDKDTPKNNEIWYTTTDGMNIDLKISMYLSCVISQDYKDGKWIVKYDNDITIIREDAFCGCSNLASITLPNSVKTIENRAFKDCINLTSVTIPNGLIAIGNRAFENCHSLNNIHIPDSVISIGRSAFSSCSSLTSIDIPEGVTSIENSTFSGCSSLRSVTIPDSVTSIGDSAFSGCRSVTSVNIPNSVTSIGRSAFSCCSSLKSINIPNSVTKIGDEAFLECSGEIIINNKSIIERSYTVDSTPYSYMGYVHDSSNYPSSNWLRGAKFSKITIGDIVTSIGDNVFYKCGSLRSITIPDNVTSIGSDAFQCCNITEFSGDASFDGLCIINNQGYLLYFIGNELSEYKIPTNVKHIGDNVFYHCRNLTSVSIPDSVTSIGDFAFSGCISLASVTIPDSVTSIGNFAFSRCRSLASVTIPNSVTTIGIYAFEYCSNLTSVYCKATTPPKTGYDFDISWSAFDYNYNRKIYVPLASVEAYKSADGWRDYAEDIVGYDY